MGFLCYAEKEKEGTFRMAHVEKYTAAAVGHMLDHYGRSPDNGVKRSNENIDPGRTHLNYNLAPDHEGGQVAFLKNRLAQVKVQKRADVNVLCDWVVTLPKEDYTEEQEKEFFSASYQFLEQKYGVENVVSAYVHKDEMQPHLHFAFIPVVPDRRRGGEKVSAKECITREDLNKFHPDFQAYLDAHGEPGLFPVINGATAGGNRTVKELQAERQIEKAQAAAQKEIAAVRQAAQDAREDLQAVQDKAEAAKERLRATQSRVDAFQAIEGNIADLEGIQPQKTLTGAIRGISIGQVEQLKAAAIRGVVAEQEVRELKAENRQLYSRLPSTREKLKEAQELEKLRHENRVLRERVRRLESALDFLCERLPEPLQPLISKVKEILTGPKKENLKQRGFER